MFNQNWKPKPLFDLTPQEPAAPQKKKGRGGTLTSLISEAAGTGGAVGGAALGASIGSVVPGLGTAIGGLIGAGVGGFVGGTGGRIAENKVRDNRIGLGDALKEGAISGVMSAGPLRLLKGAGVATKSVGKVGLTEALKQGGNAAAEFSLLKSLGGKATQAGEGAIVKGLGLTKVQKNKVLQETGETAGALAKKYGIFTADDLAPAKDALFQQFDEVTTKIGSIPKLEVASKLQKKIAQLAAQAPSDKKQMAKTLAAEAKGLLDGFGDTIDAKELNAIKGQFDSLVNYTSKQADPNKYGVNKRVADSLRDVLQSAADRAGIKGQNGLSLKEIGNELRKLSKLEPQITKNVEGAGGTSVLGLRNLLGAGVGAGTGGLPGMALGAATTAAVNNQAVRTGTAKGLIAGGEKLAARASGVGAGSIIANNALAGAGRAMGGQSSTNIDNSNINGPSMMNNQNNVQNIDPLSAPNANMSSTFNESEAAQQMDNSPFAPQNLQNTLQQVAAQGGGLKEIAQVLAIAKDYQALTSPTSSLDSTTADKVASSANATNTLTQLEDLYTGAGGGSGRLGGSIKNALSRAGLEGNTQTYNDLSASSVSQLARALNGGGQVSDADAAVVIKALPRITDSPEVAAAKFAALRARLQAARENTLMYNGAGGMAN